MRHETDDLKSLRAAEDVTPEILDAAEQASEWFADRRIDWEEFIDRLASDYGVPNGWDIEEYDNPAIRKIQKHVRDYRR